MRSVQLVHFYETFFLFFLLPQKMQIIPLILTVLHESKGKDKYLHQMQRKLHSDKHLLLNLPPQEKKNESSGSIHFM